MQFPYWDYFLVLCEDVKRTARFVEPVQENFKTFSIEFARLYLAIGSEIDVVAKLLCKKIDPMAKLSGPKININTYRQIILGKFPDLPKVETVFPRSSLTLIPWQEWANGSNPNWWERYNKVKHERNEHFPEANLENTLTALSGLLVFLGYYHSEDLRDSNVGLTDDSIIRFDRKYLATNKMLAQSGFRLPGIPRAAWLEQKLKEKGR